MLEKHAVVIRNNSIQINLANAYDEVGKRLWSVNSSPNSEGCVSAAVDGNKEKEHI